MKYCEYQYDKYRIEYHIFPKYLKMVLVVNDLEFEKYVRLYGFYIFDRLFLTYRIRRARKKLILQFDLFDKKTIKQYCKNISDVEKCFSD